MSGTPFVSVVIPAYNEAESLPELQRELAAALDALGRPWEVVYVDDGSRDGTDRAIESLAAADPRVRGAARSSAASTIGGPSEPAATWNARSGWAFCWPPV